MGRVGVERVGGWRPGFGVVIAAGLLAASAAAAEPLSATVRLAFLPRWVVEQHRPFPPAGPAARLEVFREALRGGVVDRPVFWWQRGRIQRELLVWKPVRVLEGEEAQGLGGRGRFRLEAVRRPTGGAAWTEVTVLAERADPADVLVLEVGGELAPWRQVLDSLFVLEPGGGLTELRLVPRALLPAAGVQIVRAPFERPVGGPTLAAAFQGAGGLEFLVVRSPVETVQAGEVTPNGPADVAPFRAGEWREGDRVLVRVPLGVLRGAPVGVVMGWRDRLFKPDGGGEDLRRSSFLGPLLR